MQEKISMLKVREILRLKYEHGLSARQIGLSCNVGRQTVSNYLMLARTSGINWAEDKNISDTELESKIYKSRKKEFENTGKDKIIPDFGYIHEELKKKGVTLLLLWSEYKQEHPEKGYQYEMFCLLYNRWKQKLNISMKQRHKAGEKLFVDYCDGINIVDRETGQKQQTELFVSVWGASNYTYAEASISQDQQDWLMSHVRAFEYFGCVPHIVVPDNLKAGVSKTCKYEPEINRSYLDLAQHYGIAVIPARVRRPKDKAKVEVAVLIAQRWILACLRNRIFYNLNELNQAIRELLDKLNNKKMQKLNKSRKELFESLDKPAALALNTRRYEYARWQIARVNIDYHIEIDKHYYSVPCQLIHEQVAVRINETTIEVFYKGIRQASHVRSYKKYDYTTNPEHMPEAHRKYLDQTPSKMIKKAEAIGPNTVEVIKNIFERRKYIQQNYRSCMGLMRLCEYYGRERLENACKRAVRFGVFSYQNIKAILVHKLDKQVDMFGNMPGSISPMHENVRGEDYYNNGV